MTTLESLPAELLAEIALLCRHPAYIVRLMLTSKTMYENLRQEHTCMYIQCNTRKFRLVVRNIKYYILHQPNEFVMSKISYMRRDKTSYSRVVPTPISGVKCFFAYKINGDTFLSYKYKHVGEGVWVVTSTSIDERLVNDYKSIQVSAKKIGAYTLE
jgi:hypothetical protein